MPAAGSSGRRRRRAIRRLAPCYMQRKDRAVRMRPRACSSRPPKGAVGECKAQLPWSRLSQSISPFAPPAFTGFPRRTPSAFVRIATTKRSDFCMDVVPSSLPPSGLPPGETPLADLCRPPWVRTLDVPPPPSPLPIRPRLDFGRRVHGHAHPVESACSGLHLRSVLRFASGFFSTRPHGPRNGVSRRHPLRAVASGSRLLPTRPAKDFHLQSSAHARHTHARLQGQATRGSAPAAKRRRF